MSFEMLQKIIDNCTEELWFEKQHKIAFWRLVFHALSGTHFWMRIHNVPFKEIIPGKNLYPDFDGEPEQILQKDELKVYGKNVKTGCEEYFKTLNDSLLCRKSAIYDSYTNMDVILVQIRHIQYHTGQCNTILKQKGIETVKWIE